MNSEQLLLTEEYRSLLQQMHSDPEVGWGRSAGKKWALWILNNIILKYFPKYFSAGAITILDYGCGQGSLRKGFKALFNDIPEGNPKAFDNMIVEYDAGIPDKDDPSILEKKYDIVICSDVLEHIEPEYLEHNINTILNCADKIAFFAISTSLANAILPDGRNAHLIVKKGNWWEDRVWDSIIATKKYQDGWRMIRLAPVYKKEDAVILCLSHYAERRWL